MYSVVEPLPSKTLTSIPSNGKAKQIDNFRFGLGSVAHVCNSSNLGCRDWKDHSSRPARAESYKDFISTNKPAMGKAIAKMISLRSVSPGQKYKILSEK
jgi:hypothetical protein